jgi:hypothetical protein
MCNLYHMAPREHVERYFRAMVPEYGAVPVGPFALRPVPAPDRRPAAGSDRAVGDDPAHGPCTTSGLARDPDEQRPQRNRGEPPDLPRSLGRGPALPDPGGLVPGAELGDRPQCLVADGRADGGPWAIAGLWSEWTDPATDEIVPNFTVLNVNCVGHPLLGRLHKPDLELSADAQDKRSFVPQESGQRTAWFEATPDDAMGCLLAAPPTERFDLSDAQRTEQLLGRQSGR